MGRVKKNQTSFSFILELSFNHQNLLLLRVESKLQVLDFFHGPPLRTGLEAVFLTALSRTSFSSRSISISSSEVFGSILLFDKDGIWRSFSSLSLACSSRDATCFCRSEICFYSSLKRFKQSSFQQLNHLFLEPDPSRLHLDDERRQNSEHSSPNQPSNLGIEGKDRVEIQLPCHSEEKVTGSSAPMTAK